MRITSEEGTGRSGRQRKKMSRPNPKDGWGGFSTLGEIPGKRTGTLLISTDIDAGGYHRHVTTYYWGRPSEKGEDFEVGDDRGQELERNSNENRTMVGGGL